MDNETRARIEKEAITYVIHATGYQVLPEHDHWKGAYISGATAEHSRITELLKEKDEAIETLLDELIYESGDTPGLFWMWGRTGGSTVPDKIMKIKEAIEKGKQQ